MNLVDAMGNILSPFQQHLNTYRKLPMKEIEKLAENLGISHESLQNGKKEYLVQRIGERTYHEAVLLEPLTKVGRLHTRIKELERKLKACGIMVVRWADFPQKLKTYRGSEEIYKVETIPNLIEDVLAHTKDRIDKLKSGAGVKPANPRTHNLALVKDSE